MVYGRVCALLVSHGYLVYLVVKVWEFGVDAEHRLQGALLDGIWLRPSVWLFGSLVFERAFLAQKRLEERTLDLAYL